MNDMDMEAASRDFMERILANRSPERQAVAERMEKVRSVYLPTHLDEHLSTELNVMFDSIEVELNVARRRRLPGHLRGGRALVVTGAAGAGKSRALAHAFATRPEFARFGQPGSPLLSMVASSPFTLGTLGNEIARRLGYVSRRALSQSEVWPLVRGLMREKGIRVLHIDEAQHGDQIADPNVAQNIENTLKDLMQEKDWPIWLILSGLPELARFCQDDESMVRRVRHVHFESLRFPEHAGSMQRLVRKMVSLCPPLGCGDLLSDEFAHRLLHASLWQFGIAIEYVQDAIYECLLRGGNELHVNHFADVYSARTGSVAEGMNVFVDDNWLSIPVRMALYDGEENTAGVEASGARPSGSRRRKRKKQ